MPAKKYNDFVDCGVTVEIHLTNCDEVAIVDRDDWYGGLSEHAWFLHVSKSGAKRVITNYKIPGSTKYTQVALARLVLGCLSLPKTQVTTYRDGNALNCRRENVTILTKLEQMRRDKVFDHWAPENKRAFAERVARGAKAQAIRKRYGLHGKGRVPVKYYEMYEKEVGV